MTDAAPAERSVPVREVANAEEDHGVPDPQMALGPPLGTHRPFDL